MSHTDFSSEPTPAQPPPAAETPPAHHTPFPPVNGEDAAALARLADDGAPAAREPQLSLPSTPAPLPAAPPKPASDTAALEERIRRLEETLSSLQVQRSAAPPATAVLLDVGKRLMGTAAGIMASAPMAAPAVSPPSAPGSILWLLRDTWAEARVIVRMFVDPRYRMPWSARLLPLLLLAAILTSGYWVPGSSIPILGEWLLVKLVDLLLAFILFKWLGHEARRYRQTSPDLPSSLRL